MNTYQTVQAIGECEFTVQRSRFIGRCYPIIREADAISCLTEIRKTDWEARHHCYAYIIGADSGIVRASDDGEPQGTAGKPILNVLQQNAVVNAIIVVTRYFGGILLGAGGLVRAYGATAAQALKCAHVVSMERCTCWRFDMSYKEWTVAETQIQAMTRIEHIEYSDRVSVYAWTPSDKSAALSAYVLKITNGRERLTATEEKFRAAE